MTIDLTILGLVLLFALIGAFTGAAKQVAHGAGMALAYFSARPLGTALGPRVAKELGLPLLFGTVLSTVLVFIVVLLVVRYGLTLLLRRILAGRDPENRGLDRLLGFGLGGLKVAAMAYVMLSALAYVEDNVTVAGKRLGLSPKDSVAFSLASHYNLFEYTQFGGVKDLVKVARAARNPQSARKLKADPDFQALRKDPRFQKALSDSAMREAMETGDFRPLLRSNAVLQLIQDPTMAARLAAAAGASQESLLAVGDKT